MESALVYCKEDEKYEVKPDGFGAEKKYRYMVQPYSIRDFRYPFVQHFQKLLHENLNWDVYTCKITYSPTAHLANLLNVWVYLEDIPYEYIITQQLEQDRANPAFTCFYDALKKYPLPATEEHLIRIIIKSAAQVRLDCFINQRFSIVKKSLLQTYPLMEAADYQSNHLCLILQKNCNLQQLLKNGTLENMRKTCYKGFVNCTEYQREMPYDKFHIKVDNSGVYQEKGSRWFFESDEYKNALIV